MNANIVVVHVKNKGMMDMYFAHGKKDEPFIKAKKAKIINVISKIT